MRDIDCYQTTCAHDMKFIANIEIILHRGEIQIWKCYYRVTHEASMDRNQPRKAIYFVTLKVVLTDYINVESLSTKETSNVIRRTQGTRCTSPQAGKYIHDRVGVIEVCAVYVARNGLRLI